ncbi:MAG: cytosolic protein [Rhodospirillaceae bacterium]|nr:cytosolic protein [Rhodospirillaceae bacterium]
MKAALIFTGSGPIVILTSYKAFDDVKLLAKLYAKGIDKFIAYELPVALVEERYGNHFPVVMHDLREADDLRVLDFNGERAFRLFHLNELGEPFKYEARAAQ